MENSYIYPTKMNILVNIYAVQQVLQRKNQQGFQKQVRMSRRYFILNENQNFLTTLYRETVKKRIIEEIKDNHAEINTPEKKNFTSGEHSE